MERVVGEEERKAFTMSQRNAWGTEWRKGLFKVGKRDLWADEHSRRENRRREMKRGEDLGVPAPLCFQVCVTVSFGARIGFHEHAAALGRPSGEWQAIGSEERDWRGPGHAPREMARDSGSGNARSHGRLSGGPAGGSIGFLEKR